MLPSGENGLVCPLPVPGAQSLGTHTEHTQRRHTSLNTDTHVFVGMPSYTQIPTKQVITLQGLYCEANLYPFPSTDFY